MSECKHSHEDFDWWFSREEAVCMRCGKTFAKNKEELEKWDEAVAEVKTWVSIKKPKWVYSGE